MRAILAAAVLSTTLAARADFVGFGCIRHVATGDLHRYHVMEVYAAFDDPADRVLNVFDVSATLVNGSDPSATPAFFHAEDPDSELPPSFMPIGYLPPGEAWRFDSYVTIGAMQGNMLNGTILDPSFSDHKFVQQHAITDNAGWFNLPPTNGYGLAGDGLKVLVGVFVVTEEHYDADLRLELQATIGFADGDELRFATGTRTLAFPSADTPAYSADRIDGDGTSDIVFHNPGSGRIAQWLMQGLVRTSGSMLAETAPAGHELQGMGDLDADGTADLVWRDAAGRFEAWLMQGASVAMQAPMSTPIGGAWRNIAVGDVSGDARADIVLRNDATGEVRVWLMDGFIRIAEGTVGNAAGLACEGLADFNGDGRRDLLWRAASGALQMWIMDGLAVEAHGAIANTPAVMGPAWIVAGASDMNGDAKADIVWRHAATGSVSSWYMDGIARVSGGTIHMGISLEWRIDAVRDLDGDGRGDIVWRRTTTGDVNGWLMDGRVRRGGGFIRNAHMPWSIVLP